MSSPIDEPVNIGGMIASMSSSNASTSLPTYVLPFARSAAANTTGKSAITALTHTARPRIRRTSVSCARTSADLIDDLP